MIRIIKPPRLHPGDVIGICAPASPPRKQDSIEHGIRYLESAGFRIKLGKHIFSRRGYLAGTDAQRASDMNAMFADKSVKAIFTVRGGYGSQRILPLLDYRLIRRNPKILVGYSDITALQCALLAKIGLVTFSGSICFGRNEQQTSGTHRRTVLVMFDVSPTFAADQKYFSGPAYCQQAERIRWKINWRKS